VNKTLIEIRDGHVLVNNLDIAERDVVDFIQRFPEQEREEQFVRATQVGVFCLERAQANHDTEFVRRQIESLLNDVSRAVERVPAIAQQALVDKIGTKDGQLLAPLQRTIDDVARASATRLSEVREMLNQEIDPQKESSTLGKALRTIRNLLDPSRTDSVQGTIQFAITSVSAENGMLAKAVRSAVSEAMQPLQTQMTSLTAEVRGAQVAETVLGMTTAKGETYEEEIVEELKPWTRTSGAELHHVGPDNQSGDIVIRITGKAAASRPFSLVVEARDRQSKAGRKVIAETLDNAMTVRGCCAAIYLSKSQDGLAQEIGDWAEGASNRGNWVACTHSHLITAVRFLIVQEQLAALSKESAALDYGSIESQVRRIRTALERFKNISRKVGEVRTGADAIQAEAETLRDEIRNTITSIEDILKRPHEVPAGCCAA